jgi:putative endonuclease
MFFVYILISLFDGSLYTGQTNDLQKRLQRHNQGYVRSTKRKTPYELGYFEAFQTRSEAMWREWELKTKVSTDKKKKMISEFDKAKIIAILRENRIKNRQSCQVRSMTRRAYGS